MQRSLLIKSLTFVCLGAVSLAGFAANVNLQVTNTAQLPKSYYSYGCVGNAGVGNGTECTRNLSKAGSVSTHKSEKSSAGVYFVYTNANDDFPKYQLDGSCTSLGVTMKDIEGAGVEAAYLKQSNLKQFSAVSIQFNFTPSTSKDTPGLLTCALDSTPTA